MHTMNASLPGQGECNATEQVGSQCFWKQVERVKTVALSCAMEKTRLASACTLGRALGGNWGWFDEASLQLEHAFHVCPDIQPSAAKQNVLLA